MNTTAQALGALGLTLPSPSYLFGALLFGVIGLAVWRLGRRRGRPGVWGLGVALLVYPYGISATWALWAIGVALCLGVWWALRQGE